MQKMFAKAQLTHPNKHTHIHTQSEESRRERLRHVYGLNRAEQTLATAAEFPTPPTTSNLQAFSAFPTCSHLSSPFPSESALAFSRSNGHKHMRRSNATRRIQVPNVHSGKHAKRFSACLSRAFFGGRRRGKARKLDYISGRRAAKSTVKVFAQRRSAKRRRQGGQNKNAST